MFRIFNLFSPGDAHLAIPSLRRVVPPGELSTPRGRFRSARRSRGRVLQLEPMEDRMMLSTLLSVSKTGPIHVSGPTAFHTTALSPPHTTTGRVIPSVHVSGPTVSHITALSPVQTTTGLVNSPTGLVNSPVHILTGGGGGTVQLDSDGYVENFSGSEQIVEQTWNYDKGAYDQAPGSQSLSNLKSVFDLMWGALMRRTRSRGRCTISSFSRPHSICRSSDMGWAAVA